jgi:hypothetical protein
MAHPSEDLETKFYYVPGARKLTIHPNMPETHFRRAVCSVAGTITVFGGARVIVLSVADDAAAQLVINPATGKPFVDKATFDAQGLVNQYYEKVDTTGVDIEMVAGDVIEGKFLELQGDGTIHFFAYSR